MGLVPEKALLRRGCLIHLKHHLIGQRPRDRGAMVRAGTVPWWGRKTRAWPGVGAPEPMRRSGSGSSCCAATPGRLSGGRQAHAGGFLHGPGTPAVLSGAGAAASAA